MLQVLKETSCDYNTFIMEITEMVKKMMGEEYSAKIYKIIKNNSLELDSLVLLKEGKNFAPNIYLLPYFEAYLEGTNMTVLVERLCEIYQSCTAPVTEEKFNYTFDEMKPYIIYRLVSYDKNTKLLEKIPHIKYLDLAITFHCLIHNKEDGIGTIRITNEHMETWKVSLQELKVLAVRNTKKRFPAVIRSMNDVINNMLSEEIGEEEDFSKELINFNTHNNSEHHKMYILSNPKGINGATCLLYENVLKKFTEQLHSDLFVLPSSIHEVILVPYDNTISKEALTEMVIDVNRTQVAKDEVLSDRVYYYSRKNNTISL